MLPLTLIRRPLTPSQADAIVRRAWIVPACLYAAGLAAALVLVTLIALDVPALGLRYGLAIVCIILVAFIPLVGGERVFKTDERVEAYGTVDELAAFAALLGDNM